MEAGRKCSGFRAGSHEPTGSCCAAGHSDKSWFNYLYNWCFVEGASLKRNILIAESCWFRPALRPAMTDEGIEICRRDYALVKRMKASKKHFGRCQPTSLLPRRPETSRSLVVPDSTARWHGGRTPASNRKNRLEMFQLRLWWTRSTNQIIPAAVEIEFQVFYSVSLWICGSADRLVMKNERVTSARMRCNVATRTDVW